jgi:hypothetical protein
MYHGGYYHVGAPFTFSLEADSYTFSAWPDLKVPGKIMVEVACQKQPIDYWRDHGYDIIFDNEMDLNALNREDIAAAVAGDDLKLVMEQLREVEKKNASTIETVREMHKLLMKTLDYIEDALQDSIEEMEKAARKQARRKKTKQSPPASHRSYTFRCNA